MEGNTMASEQTGHLANPESAPHSLAPLARWGRPLAIASAIVFCISSAFPAVAAFVRDTESWPKWWGVLDVMIAFVLAMLAFAVLGLAQGKVNKQAEDSTYRAYRVLTHGIFAGLVVFFLVGDWIVWSNCLTGFAWRAWLLLYSLPAWFTALRSRPGVQDSRR
jgi:hypothetical protein